ncbi:MAG: hypothetical protein JW791_03390 [Nanoarchaeota archaeon]|nr:hypothetical protein [Nanoarchaeota archaeon]
MKNFLAILIIVLNFSIVFAFDAQNPADVMGFVRDCVFKTGECDCNVFLSSVDESDSNYNSYVQAVQFCEEQKSFANTCLLDLSSPSCAELDLTQIAVQAGLPAEAGDTMRAIIEERIRSDIPNIKECVNLEGGCDCSQFPGGVDEFCQNYVNKQKACLDDYDLEACNMLEAQDIEVLPSWTPSWVRVFLEPLIRPLVEFRQEMMRAQAVGTAMSSVATCFQDPYNCDCSSINYISIRSDCERRAKLMRICLDYRDCAMAEGADPASCEGREDCTLLVNMPLVPEATPGFMKPFLEPIVLQNVCPMMRGWPYDYGNYAACE